MQKSIGMLVTISAAVQTTLVDLVYGGVFARHPELRVLSVENGAGWAPYMMQAMDVRVFLGPSRKLEVGGEALRPSDYIRRNVRITFMSDKLAMRLRDVIGLDSLLWASDYPHGESTFPNSRQVLDRQLAEVPAAEREQIVFGNTSRLYQFR
jgi:predicted TIM-barrel fold metal-dependent hydrolase